MSKMSVSCITQSRIQAERIISHLKAATFSPNGISVLYREAPSNPETAEEPAGRKSADAVEPAAAGDVQGRIANVGTLSFAIPGDGTVLACGPIIGTMLNAAPTVESGDIVGGLIGIGIAETEACLYETRISDGSILISVGTDNLNAIEIAESIFKSACATDISRTGETSRPDKATVDLPALVGFVSSVAAA